MKRLFSLLMVTVLVVLSCVVPVSADDNIKVILQGYEDINFDNISYNNLEMPQPPIIQDGRTLVPVRAIAEALGYTVDYTELEDGRKRVRFERSYYNTGNGLESSIPADVSWSVDNKTSVYFHSLSYWVFIHSFIENADKGTFVVGDETYNYLKFYKVTNGNSNLLKDTKNMYLCLKESDFATNSVTMYIGEPFLERSIVANTTMPELKGNRVSLMTIEPLDVAPTIVNGSTLIPVRAFVEALGMSANWDDVLRTVFIHY